MKQIDDEDVVDMEVEGNDARFNHSRSRSGARNGPNIAFFDTAKSQEHNPWHIASNVRQ